jgi:cell division protein FtsZ
MHAQAMHAQAVQAERASERAPARGAQRVEEPMPATMARGMRPTLPSEDLGVAPSRRAPARELSSSASVRDRASFVPPLDADWDTPTFQRRGQ